MEAAIRLSGQDGPRFSVVVPCYRAGATIATCLDSIARQRYRDYEILVVDDGDRDAELEAVERAVGSMSERGEPIRLLRLRRNGGPGAARNAGIDAARGDYVAFLDSDDRWDPNKLSCCEEALCRTDAFLLMHGYSPRSSLMQRGRAHRTRLPPLRVLLSNPAQTSAVVMRRDGPFRFDTRLRFSEDHDLWVRIAFAGKKIVFLNEDLTTLGRPQLSAGGLSGQRGRMRWGELVLAARALSRRPATVVLVPIVILAVLAKYAIREAAIAYEGALS